MKQENRLDDRTKGKMSRNILKSKCCLKYKTYCLKKYFLQILILCTIMKTNVRECKQSL